jgi:hypothetical protein
MKTIQKTRECPICHKSFNATNAARHKKRHHQEGLHRERCEHCHLTFTKAKLKTHMEKCQTAPKSICPDCGMKKSKFVAKSLHKLTCEPVSQSTASFVWTSGMDYTDMDQLCFFEDFTIPEPDYGDHNPSAYCPYFTSQCFQSLQQKLGHGFAFVVEDVPRIHQGVVMMQIMKFSHKRNAQCHLLTSRKLGSFKPDSNASQDRWNVVYILDYDNDLECAKKLCTFILEQADSKIRCRTFPSKTELDWDNSKFKDILALDQIAKKAADIGKEAYSWRPRTCHSFQRQPCALPNHHTILKASYSSQSKHVIDLGFGLHPSLRCHFTENDQEVQLQNTSERMFFHQEMVSGFDKIGEFRAIIVTRCNPSGLRNREGYVALIDHIRYKRGNPCTPTFALTGSEALWLEIAPLTIDNVHECALFVHDELRKRPDWKEHFETLEVAVRLDMSVFMGSPPKIFVNEITRFLQGSWHSNSGPQPYLGVASAIAKALNDYFPSSSV